MLKNEYRFRSQAQLFLFALQNRTATFAVVVLLANLLFHTLLFLDLNLQLPDLLQIAFDVLLGISVG